MKSFKMKLNVNRASMLRFVLYSLTFLSIVALCLRYAKGEGRSKSDKAIMKVVMFMMMMMVSMSMVNPDEDNLDTVSPLSTVHKVSF